MSPKPPKGPKAAKRVPSSALPAAPARTPKRLSGVSLNGPNRDHHPLWRLQLLDLEYEGSWHWKVDAATIRTIIVDLMVEMERLTWSQVFNQIANSKSRGTAKHKFVPVESLVPEAQRRLAELRLDDWDELFRFRLGNMARLWGILVQEGDARIFYPIWWDPDHMVCP